VLEIAWKNNISVLAFPSNGSHIPRSKEGGKYAVLAFAHSGQHYLPPLPSNLESDAEKGSLPKAQSIYVCVCSLLECPCHFIDSFGLAREMVGRRGPVTVAAHPLGPIW